MNPYQPSANDHTVQQRLDDRRAAATTYRLATMAKPSTGPGPLTRWRCAVGNRLTAIGENLTTPRSPQLPTA
ncbi:hypothetical protein BH23ACT4_BH23ACT4_11810 [soil metagenome]